MILFVLDDKQHVVEEVLAESSLFKVGLGELLKSFLVEGILKVLELPRN